MRQSMHYTRARPFPPPQLQLISSTSAVPSAEVGLLTGDRTASIRAGIHGSFPSKYFPSKFLPELSVAFCISGRSILVGGAKFAAPEQQRGIFPPLLAPYIA